MIKNNKLKAIISSVIILLPALIFLFGRNTLPEKIATHWGFDGIADGWSNPFTAFIIFPVILLAFHWLCLIITAVIDKDNKQSKKLQGIVFFIIPAISLSISGFILSVALGHTNNVYSVLLIVLGLTFIIIGNYMPKTSRNRTMGIKLKWTLANDENWNATHRFGGKVFVVAGFIFLLAIALSEGFFPVVSLLVIALAVILPTVYSYAFYKKQLKRGEATKAEYKKEYKNMLVGKGLYIIITVVLIVILIAVLSVVMFTGSLDIALVGDSVEIEASFFDDLTVSCDDIDAIEYREKAVSGRKEYGFNSAKLLLGAFKNDEFGSYIRYTYTGDAPCIVLTVDGKKIVISTADAESTKILYEQIADKIAE